MIGHTDSDQFFQIVYLLVLLLFLCFGFFFVYRRRLGSALRHLFVWLSCFFLLIVGYAFKDEMAYIGRRALAELVPGVPIVRHGDDDLVLIELRRRNNGHFIARVQINGVFLPMLVDTGASLLTLSHEDARSIGLDVTKLFYQTTVKTANGNSKVAPVWLEHVSIAGLNFHRVDAMVAQQGALDQSLLGLNILNRLVSYKVYNDRLILEGRLNQ